VGKVEDFVVDDEGWGVRHVVVETGNVINPRQVLVSVQNLEEVRWAERNVYVDLFTEQIESAPPFDPSEPVNEVEEVVQYDYQGRPQH
jgi:hypothetical protein